MSDPKDPLGDKMPDPVKLMQLRDLIAEKSIMNSHCVVGIEYKDGALMMSSNMEAPWQKSIYELYDKIMIGAAGKRVDYDRLRRAMTQRASYEGFAYSRDDVHASRLIDSLLSPVLDAKNQSLHQLPFQARFLFAELMPGDNVFFRRVNFDGNVEVVGGFAVIGGASLFAENYLHGVFKKKQFSGLDLEEALDHAFNALSIGVGGGEATELLKGHHRKGNLEAAVLQRDYDQDRKFRYVSVPVDGARAMPTLYPPDPVPISALVGPGLKAAKDKRAAEEKKAKEGKSASDPRARPEAKPKATPAPKPTKPTAPAPKKPESPIKPVDTEPVEPDKK